MDIKAIHSPRSRNRCPSARSNRILAAPPSPSAVLQCCSSHCISTTQLYKLPGLTTDHSECRYTSRRRRAHHHQLLPKKSQLAYVRCNQSATPTCMANNCQPTTTLYRKHAIKRLGVVHRIENKVKFAKKRREADFLSRSLVTNLIRFH